MKLRAMFTGIDKGDVCTGTIMRFGLQSERLKALGYITEKAGDCLVRLPLFVSLSDAQQDEVVARALEFQP